MSPSTATRRPSGLGRQIGQQVEGGDRAGRAGVIGVVDDGAFVDARHDDQPQLTGNALHARDDFFPLQPFDQTDRCGAQRRMHAVPAQQRHAHVERVDGCCRCGDSEIESGCHPCPQLSISSAHRSASGVKPIAKDAGRRQLGHGAHPLVVPIENGDTAFVGRRAAPVAIRTWQLECAQSSPGDSDDSGRRS